MSSHPLRSAWLLGLALVACGGADRRPASSGDSSGATSRPSGVALTGAGATFPNPIYSKWFDAYARETGVRINYQSTDGPMTDQQIAAVQGKVLHVPTVLGAVVATYNLPALGQAPLRFDGPTLADIFLGRITRWNDRRIAQLNPGVKLPAEDILVVHRSDGSGTTYIFTDFLAKVSPEWKRQVGQATSVEWPVGLGGKGNEGVTQQVKQSEGSIGYVELIYAQSNDLPAAEIRNSAGAFITPTLKAVSAAAESASFAPDTDFRVSITNAAGAEAYPIASFTWILIHTGDQDTPKGKAIRAFLAWMLEPGPQRMAADLHYGPLPVKLIELIRQRLRAS